MPLVAHNALPTFERLRQDGITVLSTERAANQEIRELHVGLLNMMPDAALEATERQFYRLVGESNPIAQFYMHPFTLPTLPRGEAAQAHIAQFYESFEAIRAAGLDALIITGANVSHPNLADESFWQPLIEVIDWAWDNVTSTLCSCLATHAVMQFRHGQARVKQPQKIWGGVRASRHRRPPSRWWPTSTPASTCRIRAGTTSRARSSRRRGSRCWSKARKAGVHLAVSLDRPAHRVFSGASRIRHHFLAEGIQARSAARRRRQAAGVAAVSSALFRPPGTGTASRVRQPHAGGRGAGLSPKRACCRCSTTPGTIPPRR